MNHRTHTPMITPVIIIVLSTAVLHASTEFEWNAPGNHGGNWTLGTNWLYVSGPITVPPPNALGEAAYLRAFLDETPYTVTLNDSVTIDWLSITTDDATLNLENRVLTLGNVFDSNNWSVKNEGTIIANNGTATIRLTHNNGSFFNETNGLIRVENGDGLYLDFKSASLTNNGTFEVGTGGNVITELLFDSDVNCSGSGDIRMVSSQSRIQTGAGDTLTNGAGHTIHGRGILLASLINDGEIIADTADGSLSLSSNPKTNNGLLKATNSSTLYVDGITLTNTGGTLLADGGDIQLTDNTAIVGGTFNAVAPSLILCDSTDNNSITLSEISNTGLLRVDSDEIVTVTGSTLANTGTIEIGIDGNVITELLFDSDVNCSGSGDIRMVSSQSRIQTGAGDTLTNGAGHTIHGRGILLASLINDGEIIADTAGGSLSLSSNPKTNNGLLKATNSSTLYVDGITLTNTGGTLLADGGDIQLTDNTAIVGGTLNSIPPSFVRSNTATLTNVTNEGLFIVDAGDTVQASGMTLTNNGTIELGSDDSVPTSLIFSSTMTLDGTGNLHMKSSASRIQASGLVTLTNGAGHTIYGQGLVQGFLINDGAIIADSAGGSLSLSSWPKTNNGLLKATNSSTLYVDGITLTNTGGTLLADGGDIQLTDNTAIVGGTLNAVAPSLILCDSTDNNSITLSEISNTGLLRVDSDEIVTVTGSTLANTGTIEIGIDGNVITELLFDSDVNCSGSGDIRMVSSQSRIQTGAGDTLTNGAGHTIHGRGILLASLINDGEIIADTAGGSLSLSSNPKTNNGLLKATNSSTLYVDGITLTNTGGTLLADGGAIEIGIASFIDGGTFEARDSGVLNVHGTATNGMGGWDVVAGVMNLTSTAIVETDGVISIRKGGSLELYDDGATGAFLSGGNLLLDGTGALRVEPWCDVTLSGNLVFAMTDEVLWSWSHGANLTMTGVGEPRQCSTNPWALLEVGCQDQDISGPASEDFTIGQLWLTPGANISLVDWHDNGNRNGPGGTTEVLYVWYLDIPAGATLNLNGLRLFRVTDGPTPSVEEVFECSGCWGGGDVINDVFPIPGDVNFDHQVDGSDIHAFMTSLSSGLYDCHSDMNGDSVVDMSDIPPFVAILVGS